MPNFKKNAMNQIMFPMVDKTDFASIESGITASDFNSAATKKIFGVNHGVSDAFTSATISKAATLVRSGIFQQTLKASECNYDYLIVSFRHASCADQILIFQPQEIDPSDVYSMVSDFLSDFQSRVPKAVATNSQLSDLHSDLRSYLVGMSGVLSDVYSNLSDLKSDFQSRVPKAVATNSQLSDLHSDIRSLLDAGTPLDASTLSDLRSAIAGVTATLSASDISDIASAVKVILASDISDILSAAVQTNSRVLVVQSRVSDVQSFLSDMNSDLISHIDTTGVNLNASVMSDLRSAIAGVTATLSASDISDIASAVKVILASDMSDILSAAVQTNSRVLVVQSRVSDVESALDSQFAYESNALSDLLSYLTGMSGMLSDIRSNVSDLDSNFQSRVPKEVASKSLLSDVHSDLRSHVGGLTFALTASDISDIASAVKLTLASDISDILSAATQTNSRVLVVQSHASNIYSLLSDVQSDFQSRVPKEVSSKSLLSDVNSDLRSLIGVGIPTSLSASDMSDIRSAIAAGPAATITASDISNIASAVYAMFFGDGAVEVTLTSKDGADLLEGVDVWVTTDLAGTDIVARGYSNTLGILTVYLDPGTYYVWKQLSGYTFTNPEAITVT